MFFKRMILLVIFITTVSYGQVVNVNGVVLSEDNKTLSNVEIGLVSSNGEYNTEVKSGVDGSYTFMNVPHGHYTIVYSYNNFSDFKT
ncbi:carboxypeptidase regulatory-like domain-containing protein, partial [Acinetobacter towneri]